MENFLETLVRMSISGALISVVIMLLRIPFRKAPRKYSYMLWGILGVRLLCPFSLPSPASLFNLLRSNDGSSGTEVITNRITAPFVEYRELQAGQVQQSVQITQSITLTQVLFWIWAAGAVIFAVYMLMTYFRLRRRVAGAVRISDDIYECNGIPTAFVMGMIRPRIYLPAGLESQDKDFITAHERTHIRRRDNIIKPLAVLILCVHWFNPLVWVSFFLMVRDMEISCDERVVCGLDVQSRKEYANALLNMSAKQSRLTGVLAFGESSIKQRIKSVLSPRKPTLWISIAVVAVIVIAAVCLLTDARKSPESSSPEPPESLTSSQEEQTVPAAETTSEPETSVPVSDVSESVEAPELVKPPLLTEENAAATVQKILGSFQLTEESGNLCISFDMPDNIPESSDGKTQLYISLGADYYMGGGTYSHERLLDNKIMEPSGSYSTVIVPDGKEFLGSMLRAAFMTDIGDNAYRTFYADYVELSPSDVGAGPVSPKKAEVDGATIRYTFSGDNWVVRFNDFPADMTLEVESGEVIPGIPLINIKKNGEIVGDLGFYSFGTTQSDELAQVDPMGEGFPMQIYSQIGLSSQVDYSHGYHVVSGSETGSSAVAEPVYGDGTQAYQCIYAFDRSVVPYFLMLSLTPDTVTDEELTNMARELTLSIN